MDIAETDIIDGEAPVSPSAASMRIPLADKLIYGVGQLGEGLQGSAALSLLLFFYSQVVGLNAAIVGTGIMLTGLLNGTVDAFIGSWSDVTRSRWGRRHPYLYFSPIPAAISMVLLFSPPQSLSPSLLFVWLFFWYTALRVSMTVFLVPHWALGAEMSRDYHERIGIVSSRIFFSFFGSSGFFILNLLFFKSKGDGANPLLRAQPYLFMALLVGAIVILSELGSAWGTRKYIPHLPQRPADAKALTPAILWREVRGLFRNRAFVIFFTGAMILSVGLGAIGALTIFMGTYFWHLSSDLILILSGSSPLAFASGTFFWAVVARRIGKKRTFITGIVVYGVLMSILPVMKISGGFFAADSAFYFPTILSVTILGGLGQSAYGVMAGSILPDIVDDYARQTGRRIAGVITGFLVMIATFGAAAAQFLSGATLTLIGLAPKALPDSVPVDVTNKLGYVTAAAAGGCALLFVLVFRLYPLIDPKRAPR
jgi:Na+/melibiose symporter-like transporter